MPSKKVAGGAKKSVTISEGIFMAMQTEIEGHEFYKMVAAKSKDAGAKDMFNSLAKDEADHYRWLEELYGDLAKNPRSKPPRIKARPKYKLKSPIFSKDFLNSRNKKNLEMSALSIGILLEQNAIEHYKKQAEIAKESTVQRFFDNLVHWEGEHLRLLIAQKQFLMREIFAQARFEPF